MNWIYSVIDELQHRLLDVHPEQKSHRSNWSRLNERDVLDRRHQFRSRLVELDKRISDLRS